MFEKPPPQKKRDIWVVPKIGVHQNGWFIMENPIKIDNLGGFPIFLETPIWQTVELSCGSSERYMGTGGSDRLDGH